MMAVLYEKEEKCKKLLQQVGEFQKSELQINRVEHRRVASNRFKRETSGSIEEKENFTVPIKNLNAKAEVKQDKSKLNKAVKQNQIVQHTFTLGKGRESFNFNEIDKIDSLKKNEGDQASINEKVKEQGKLQMLKSKYQNKQKQT